MYQTGLVWIKSMYNLLKEKKEIGKFGDFKINTNKIIYYKEIGKYNGCKKEYSRKLK